MINLNCQSCGMPMDKPEDHGGGDVNNPFCKYCTDEQGNLMPREQVRAKMIQFYIEKQGKPQEEAEKLTDQLMGTMPAWKGEGVGAATPTEPATPPAPEPEPVIEAAPEPTTPPVQPTEPSEPAAETTPEPTIEEQAEVPKPEDETRTE